MSERLRTIVGKLVAVNKRFCLIDKSLSSRWHIVLSLDHAFKLADFDLNIHQINRQHQSYILKIRVKY